MKYAIYYAFINSYLGEWECRGWKISFSDKIFNFSPSWNMFLGAFEFSKTNFALGCLKINGKKYRNKIGFCQILQQHKGYKAGVINDPLGQSTVAFAWFLKFWDGRTLNTIQCENSDQ